jgi:hypothetical protein
VINAERCTIEPGHVQVDPNSGTLVVTPEATTAYILMARGFGGTTAQPVVVDVVPVAITGFAATPWSIEAGQSTTLEWSTEWATAVSIDQGIGPVPLDGAITVTPARTTTYTLTAQGFAGPVTAKVTVAVGVAIMEFTATPSTVQNAGDPVTLSWSTVDSSGQSIDHGVGAVQPSGSVVVQPGQSQTYTMTATGPGGPVTAAVPVTVVNQPRIIGTSPPNGTRLETGDWVNIGWTTQGCARCHLTVTDGGQVFDGDVEPNGNFGATSEDELWWTVTLTGYGPFAGSDPVQAVFGIKWSYPY